LITKKGQPISGHDINYSFKIKLNQQMTTSKHKVFISYHHGDKTIDPRCGRFWKERFEHLFHNNYEVLITKSVQEGDIKDGIATETTRQKIRDEFISEATVTVVLIGP
jgi:hypothetical protein